MPDPFPLHQTGCDHQVCKYVTDDRNHHIFLLAAHAQEQPLILAKRYQDRPASPAGAIFSPGTFHLQRINQTSQETRKRWRRIDCLIIC